jgi:hypothetical protein
MCVSSGYANAASATIGAGAPHALNANVAVAVNHFSSDLSFSGDKT